MTLDVRSYDDLSELYRAEIHTGILPRVAPKVYDHMADVVWSLAAELDAQRGADPESILCDGARQRLREARRIHLAIRRTRAKKVAALASEPETSLDDMRRSLTDEELELFIRIRSAIVAFMDRTDLEEVGE